MQCRVQKNDKSKLLFIGAACSLKIRKDEGQSLMVINHRTNVGPGPLVQSLMDYVIRNV